jgi:hypothetical protein
MALNQNPNVYTGGAVEFDSRPHTQLYVNLMQRKQARDEAFDEYMRNLNKSVNSAGMRNADRQVFDKQLQAWQQYGMENRDKIRKREGGADIKFMQDYQTLQNLIQESKTEEEKKKPLVEMMLDPNKRERLGDSIVDEVSSHDEPLYIQGEDGSLVRNPNRKSIDYNSITFNPKPFEQDKFFKQFEDVKRMELPPSIEKNNKDMTQTVTTTSVYDQEAKDLIATRAVTDYMQNPSFREVVKGLNKEDYNPIFRANYGHDIENEGDLAAAYTLKGLQQKVTTSKLEPDTFGRQVAMEGIRDANARRRLALQNTYAKGRIDYRKAGSKQEQDGVLEGIIERTFNEGKDKRGAAIIKGKAVPARQIAVPVDITKAYTVKDEDGKDKVPIKFLMSEDKKYIVPVYPGESTKDREGSYIPVETFRNQLGKAFLTRKDAAAEMDEEIDFGEDEEVEEEATIPTSSAPVSKKHPLPSGKPRTVKQGNYTYTWDESTGGYR